MAETKGNSSSSGGKGDDKTDAPPPLVTLVLLAPVDGFAAGRVVKAPEPRAKALQGAKPPQAARAKPDQISLAGITPTLTA